MALTAGGGGSRPVVRDNPGVWVLIFDLGGQPWRVATRTVRVPSRRYGTVLARAGLSALDFAVDSDTQGVVVRGPEAETWARARRRYGPAVGRRFELWRWYSGDLEDGRLVLQGTISAAAWGDASDPFALSLTLRRSLREQAQTLPPEDAKVDTSTWPTRVGYNIPEGLEGQGYPWVFGYPGDSRGVGNPFPSTPGLLVDGRGSITDSYMLVAGHPVAPGTQVQVHNLSATPPESILADVVTMQDLLGREVSVVEMLSVLGGITVDETHEYVVGWDRRYGGGVLDGAEGGALVEGLGDFLLWGQRRFSKAVVDWGELQARRAALNQFAIDTYTIKPTNWSDYLDANVLHLFDAEAVDGQRGLYYRLVRFEADRRRVRARLTADKDGGVPVYRVEGPRTTGDEIVNRVTVQYDPVAGSSNQFRSQVTVGPSPEEATIGTRDSRVSGSILAKHSDTFYGPRPKTFQTVMTSTAETAQALARRKLAKHAMPAELVTYRGGVGLAGLRIYDTVQLQDSSPGAYYQNDLAVVWGRVMEDRDTYLVTLRVPYDPLRAPTLNA